MSNTAVNRRAGRKSDRRPERILTHQVSHRLRDYGLTPEEYNSLAETHGNKCAGCGRTPDLAGKRKNLCVDHDHASGKIRGLLCHPCNIVLGLSQNNSATLRASADYLDRACTDGTAPSENLSAIKGIRYV
jgi:hypothetical protein